MANENEYRLDYTAEEINEKLGMVVDMTETNGKIDGIAENVAEAHEKLDMISQKLSFHMKTGTLQVGEEGDTDITMRIDCPPGSKILVVEADRTIEDTNGKTTYERILESTEQAFIGAVGQALTTLTPVEENQGSSVYPFYWSYMVQMTNTSTTATPTWAAKQTTTMFRNNGEQTTFGAAKRIAGYYNWTAYYWDEE